MMRIFEMCSAWTAHPHPTLQYILKPYGTPNRVQIPSSIFRFYSLAAQPRLPEFLLMPS